MKKLIIKEIKNLDDQVECIEIVEQSHRGFSFGTNDDTFRYKDFILISRQYPAKLDYLIDLNGEIFDTILEAQVITEKWREHYNKVRPHSSLNFAPPVPEVILPRQVASA